MSGSVLFALILVVVLFVAGIFMSPLFIIPAVVVLLTALFAGPLLAAIGRGGGAGSGDTPTTGQAAYDPVSEPTERNA